MVISLFLSYLSYGPNVIFYVAAMFLLETKPFNLIKGPLTSFTVIYTFFRLFGSGEYQEILFKAGFG
jgi:hypothetical protein